MESVLDPRKVYAYEQMKNERVAKIKITFDEIFVEKSELLAPKPKKRVKQVWYSWHHCY